jgi:uncharacterized protein YecE (DUF72 family)
MLAFYAERLATVEINNTFYRLPKTSLLEKWRDETPGSFRFALKASRRITHIQRLRDCGELVEYFYRTAAVLGDKLGPVLFQLPPNFKKDVALLKEFLALLPPPQRAAFEFRNPSWFEDDVYSTLRERDVALCAGDVDDEARSPPLVATASWGYLRLRRSDYSHAEIAGWGERITSQPWKDAYVFMKHEERGPELAQAVASACDK